MCRQNPYIYFKSGVFFAFHNKDCIILDLCLGKYHVIGKKYYDDLQEVFNLVEDGVSIKKIPSKKIEMIEALKKINILEQSTKKTKTVLSIESNKVSAGLSKMNWKIPHTSHGHFSFKKFCQSLFWIMSIHLILKVRGMQTLLNLLQRRQKKKLKKSNPLTEEMLASYVRALKYAVFFCPYKTKCLEWASAMHILLKNNFVNTDFNIAVQNMPFYAHAWLSLKGKPLLAQDEESSEKLSLIFSTKSS